MSIIQNPFYNNIPSYGKKGFAPIQNKLKENCHSHKKTSQPAEEPVRAVFLLRVSFQRNFHTPQNFFFKWNHVGKSLLYYPLAFRPRDVCIGEEEGNFYIFLRIFREKLPIFANFFVNYI